jgi:glucosamine kinase
VDPVLVIDGGGSGSRARLVDSIGRSTVVEGAAISLSNLAAEEVYGRVGALTDRLPALPDRLAVHVGVAGGGNPARANGLKEWLSARLREPVVMVGRDIDLLLSQLRRPGAALVVGTGAVAIAQGPCGEVAVDGYGFALGDRGGGTWIGVEAVRSSLRAYDETGTPSPLLDALLGSTGASEPQRLFAALAPNGALEPGLVASLAPVVLAHAGDPIAADVVARAVREVAASVSTAVTRSGRDRCGDIVATGGLLKARPFAEALLRELRERFDCEMRQVDPLEGRICA